MRIFIAAAFLSVSAAAAPREFPFTWTSESSSAGANQFEAWLTPRLVRTDDYARVDTRLAWVRGVTQHLESALAVDFDVEGTHREHRVDPKVSSTWKWSTWRSPASPFAMGGVARASVGPDVFEAEARLFADLKVERLLVALNVAASRALFWAGRSDIDTRLEESLGVSFAMSSSAAFGFEFRSRSAWQRRDYQGTALYLGPTLRFTHPVFWVSLGGYAQFAAQKAAPDKPLAEPQELRDNERFVLRLTIGATVK
jgi:hypothetical protein